MAPSVAIIILCYNGVHDTLACLRSLARITYPPEQHTIIVVDNGSSDDTVSQVRAAYPHVVILENRANLGFAAGNNVGLRYALNNTFAYTLLLNNDTEVDADFLSALVDVAEASPGVGVVGPTIYYYERPDMIWSAGGGIDWRRGHSVGYGHGQPDCGQYAAPGAVAQVSGCALLVKRAALERAGLLDERFFMYYEEIEWCVRVARAGYQILHVPASRVLHKIPLNARFDREYLAYYMTRNRLLFLRATGAPPRVWLNALILQDLRTYLSLVVRPKWRRRAGRQGMRLAWADFWRGRFGMLAHSLEPRPGAAAQPQSQGEPF